MNRILILCLVSLIIPFIVYSQNPDNHSFEQREKSILCKSNADFSSQNSLVQLETYCDAYGGLDNYEFIDGVEFGEISNMNSGINFYGDFTNLSTTVTPGVSYPLKIYTGNPYTYDDYGVWIDWNADNVFDPVNEQVVCEINNGQPLHTWEIQVPLDVSSNSVIMRIRLKYIDSDCGSPCGSTSYGEVEDYSIVIEDVDKISDTENKASIIKRKSDYCEANGGLNNYEYIDGILFGDIVNLESGINFYGDFTGMSTTVQPGLTYPIQIIVENFKNFTDYGIWIDWNGDYNFSEEEQVVCVIDEGSPNSIFYIEVPEDTPNIETRMRIRLKSIGSSCGNPCGASDYGEVEDYSVIVGTGTEICIPEYINGCAMGDGITNFTLGEIVNLNSGCEDNMGFIGWSQYLDLGPAVLEKGDTYGISISSGSGDNYVSLWIDWNDNLILTPDEIVISNFWIEYPDQLYSVDLEIPDFAPSGQHLLRMRSNTGSFCNDPCIVYDYGEAEDYLVEIINGTGAGCQFFDDFESYQVGEQLVIQNPNDWTTWPNIPGSDKDPYIVDNGGNVVEITGTNDLIHIIDNYTSGIYSISFDVFIPTGADGYFNTFQEFAGSSSSWGMQVFLGFNSVGVGSIDGGAQNAATFNFEYDTWQMVKILVDLDSDWAKFFFDGELIHEWVWSTGAFGTNNLNQLGGSNFYAWPDGVYGNPLYHFDNYCIEEVLIPSSPTNLSFEISGSDILLSWDYDPGYWIYWDQQINSGDGIGLYDGGTFYVASHWYPEDLEPYDGRYVTKMNYYHYENAPNASFVLKVWTGPDAENEILSQPVGSQIGWNEIDLFIPVFISSSQDYWFGYEVTHPEGEDPAGIDFGPAIVNRGDMVSIDGLTWNSMSIEYGLDCNWNLGVYVLTENGEKSINQNSILKFPGTISNGNIVKTENSNDIYRKFGQYQPKIFEGFNVYFAHNSGSFKIIASGIMEPNYLIVNPEPGWHEYFITATANSIESGPTNTIIFWVPYTDINIYDEQSFVEIYPIPTNNSININSADCIYEISIYSTIGERVLNKKTNSNNIKLDVSSYKNGIYLLLLHTEHETLSRRIVIK